MQLKLFYEDMKYYDIQQTPSYDMYNLLGKFLGNLSDSRVSPTCSWIDMHVRRKR